MPEYFKICKIKTVPSLLIKLFYRLMLIGLNG